MLQMSSSVNNPISYPVSVCLNLDVPKCSLTAYNVSLYLPPSLWHYVVYKTDIANINELMKLYELLFISHHAVIT